MEINGQHTVTHTHTRTCWRKTQVRITTTHHHPYACSSVITRTIPYTVHLTAFTYLLATNSKCELWIYLEYDVFISKWSGKQRIERSRQHFENIGHVHRICCMAHTLTHAQAHVEWNAWWWRGQDDTNAIMNESVRERRKSTTQSTRTSVRMRESKLNAEHVNFDNFPI